MENERPDDFEVVRLALARQRRQGQPFDQAWEMALGALPVSHAYPRRIGAVESDLVRAALEATRDAWLAGYERRPPPPSPYRQAAVVAQVRAAMAEVAVAA
jgi:hypothetical protein